MRLALACAIFIAAAWPCAAQTQAPLTREPTVVSGKQSQVGFRLAINPDCSSAGEIDARILKKPEHGTLEITEGTAYPRYPEKSDRFHCNEQKVPASLVMYKSDDGYSGKDYIEVEFIGPLGGDFIHKYFITVK